MSGASGIGVLCRVVRMVVCPDTVSVYEFWLCGVVCVAVQLAVACVAVGCRVSPLVPSTGSKWREVEGVTQLVEEHERLSVRGRVVDRIVL